MCEMKKLMLTAIFVAAASAAAAAQSGKITGKLTYPGEGIPTDLAMCVQVTSPHAGPTFCSNDSARRLRDAKVVFAINRRRASYSVTVPAGSYQIFATTNEMRGVKAYYNDFVKCGMSIECKSKRPITLKVAARKTKSGITVGDFWD